MHKRFSNAFFYPFWTHDLWKIKWEQAFGKGREYFQFINKNEQKKNMKCLKFCIVFSFFKLKIRIHDALKILNLKLRMSMIIIHISMFVD